MNGTVLLIQGVSIAHSFADEGKIDVISFVDNSGNKVEVQILNGVIIGNAWKKS
jgi:hypothetical protein